jgi:hypothetical protein
MAGDGAVYSGFCLPAENIDANYNTAMYGLDGFSP